MKNTLSDSAKVKKTPKVISFTPIKAGVTETGIEYIFCKSYGMGIKEGVFIEKRMLDKLNIDSNSFSYKIGTNQFMIEKTVKGIFYKFHLRVPPKLWFQIEGLKKKFKNGVDWETVKKEVENEELELEEIKNSRFGNFISIQPIDVYLTKKIHQIHLYPGKSIKDSGMNKLSLLDYIEKNKDRITFKYFSKGDNIFYRFYLRKIKNSYNKNKKILSL